MTPRTRSGPEPDVGLFPAVPGLDVLGELGRGAASTVYRVRRDGADYALKVLDSPQEGTLVAFRREATLLAALDHPDLPRVHEVGTIGGPTGGQTGGRAYLVMDYVAGRPLADLVAGQALDPWQVVTLALDLVDPLAAMHRQGLVHRDLKPQNIMVLDDGTARMIDFGLAVRLTGHEHADDTTVGTLAYAPPEQAGTLKRPVDHRSDLYSLGVVLFECLTGTLPFVAATTGDLLHLHATAPAPDVRALAPAVPETLGAIVATLLAKDPDDRYQSAEALALDLGQLLENPDTRFEPRPAASSRHRPAGTPLRGRDGELRQVLDAWAGARQGRGRLVVVRGSEGVGKTRLMEEVVRVLGRDDVPVMACRGALDAPLPLAPLRQAVERLLLEAGTATATRRAELHRQMKEAAGAAAGLLAGLSPALAAVLGAEPLTDADRQDQFSAALGRFVCELARLTGGLALVIDDAHLADPATVRVFGHIAVSIRDVPLFVLCARRDDAESPAEAVTDEAVADTLRAALDRTIVLPPLTEEAVHTLVADRLPGIDAASGPARLLLVRGHGNPFVIVEYLRAIVDAGLLRPHWGTWQLDDEALDGLALPEDALGLVLARIAALTEETRRLLVVAAVAGPRFLPDVVAEAAQVDLDRALEAMTDATAHRLIELRDGGDHAFVHERVRAALLDGIPPAGLAHLHQNIASALDRRYRAGACTPTGGDDVSHLLASPAAGAAATRDGLVYAVAEHYRLGEADGPQAAAERARGFCTAAGRLALAAQAPDRAVTFLEHAVARRPGDPRLLHLFGTALLRAGRHAEAIATLRRALPLETDPVRRARLLLSITEVHRATWSTTEAIAAVEQGLAELGARLPRTAAGRVVGTLARTLLAAFIAVTGWGFATARGAERERLDLVAALHRQGGYSGTVSLTPGLLFMHHLRALLPAVRLGAGREHALNTSGAALLAAMVGLRRLSRRLTGVAERAAAAVGDPQLVAQVAWYAGVAAYMGRVDDGQRWAACLDEHGHWLDAGMYSDAIASLSWDAATQGRSADVLRWYERGRRRISFGTGAGTTSLVTIAAVARTAAGRVVEAEAELRQQRAVLENHQGKGLRVNQALAEMYALTEQDELGAPFEEVVARFFALGLTPRRMIRQHRSVFALYARARLAQARREPGPGPLRAAREAVKLLGAVADTPLLKACHQQGRAELDILAGHPRRALARLSRIPPQREDAPLPAFAIACTRARALRAAGYPADAGRAVLGATAIAEAQGWPLRARRLADEFGVHLTTHEGRSLVGSREGESDLQTGRERRRLAALEAVSAAAARLLDPDDLARVALDQTLQLLSAERAVLFLTGPDGEQDDAGARPLRPHLTRDAEGNDVPQLTGYSASLVELVRRTGEPLVVTGTDEGAALGAQSVVLHNLRSVMVAPLMLEKRMIGVVYLDSQVATGVFTSGDIGILTALTTYIATSLETARAAQLELSVRTADRQRDLAEKLRDALTDMSSSLDPEQVLTRLVAAAGRLLPGERRWLLRPETSGPATTAGMLAPTTLNARVAAPGSITTLVFDRELTAVLNAGRAVAGGDDGSPSAPPQLRRLLGGAGSWLLVPLSSDGAAVGVLVVAAADQNAFAQTEVEVAGTLVAQGLTAYEKATLFARVQELAVVDELTGISTRRHFFELAGRELNSARRHARPMVAMMVDIDHFKRVNDTHGHPTGDDVIREVAARLSGVLRDTDVLGRYGGEEFAVVLPDSDRGEETAERMLNAVARTPMPTRSGPVEVTISVGLTRLTADDFEIPSLIDRADLALYAAKEAGRNQVQVR